MAKRGYNKIIGKVMRSNASNKLYRIDNLLYGKYLLSDVTFISSDSLETSPCFKRRTYHKIKNNYTEIPSQWNSKLYTWRRR